MSPRAPAYGSGLPGPGQDIFPEAAKEWARRLALYPDELDILRHTRQTSSGVTTYSYLLDSGGPFRGRVDPTSSNTAGVLRGDAIEDESSEHLVTFDDEVELDTEDRLLWNNEEWIITSLRERTDRMVTRAEIRRAD